MPGTSFYTEEELAGLGLNQYGKNVLISKKCSIYRPETIRIGNNSLVDDFCILSGEEGEITIGNFVHIACYSALFGSAGIEMDDFSGLSLTNPTIPIEFRPGVKHSQITLERHALVGSNSTILPSVIIEERSAVGAHSLVMKSCKAWTLYFGSPAKPIRSRKKDLLELEAAFLKSMNKSASS